MTTKNTKNTKSKTPAKQDLASRGSLKDLKTKLQEIKLAIKAHQEKNTNAHKAIKKQIAQLLTKGK